tara:strand:+ start:1430 stop:1639 length:210 start_codon:yes stop_codon:yes gene_type:complete
MEIIARKVLDTLSDSRYTVSDIDYLGFHIINNASRYAEKNALILADAIIHYQENPFTGGTDESNEGTLF